MKCDWCGRDICTCSRIVWVSFKELLAHSSVGAGLCDIKERGIDAHLRDMERPRRRRKR